jgi:hypothetical protein
MALSYPYGFNAGHTARRARPERARKHSPAFTLGYALSATSGHDWRGRPAAFRVCRERALKRRAGTLCYAAVAWQMAGTFTMLVF